MPDAITYSTDMSSVDWREMKSTLVADNFDNLRTPEEYRESFESSYVSVVAYDGDGRIIGTSRALSDGVCNAYVVDVWTLSKYRNRGIASAMMGLLEERLGGQHIYLFTDDAQGFYHKLGYAEQGTGLAKVVGNWLNRYPPRTLA